MKKRLTARDEYGNADVIGCDTSVFSDNLTFDELNLITNALNRLADYEECDIHIRENFPGAPCED